MAKGKMQTVNMSATRQPGPLARWFSGMPLQGGGVPADAESIERGQNRQILVGAAIPLTIGLGVGIIYLIRMKTTWLDSMNFN